MIFIYLIRSGVHTAAGRTELPKVQSSSEAWNQVLKERRCDSQSRGSLYDSKAGRLFRQKELVLAAHGPKRFYER